MAEWVLEGLPDVLYYNPQCDCCMGMVKHQAKMLVEAAANSSREKALVEASRAVMRAMDEDDVGRNPYCLCEERKRWMDGVEPCWICQRAALSSALAAYDEEKKGGVDE